ncbi:MAG: glycoside hydrolase family 28 protein, partial [Duncaniella sp.]|nr:glycoside hydrolase family 28 protein [Duncaniella sp.]
KKSKLGVKIEGFEYLNNVYNIECKNCDWTGVATDGNDIKGLTRDVRLIDVTINGKPSVI